MARTPPAERAPLPCYPSLPSLLPAHYARRCCFAAQNRPRGSSNLPGSHGKGPRSSVGASGGGPEPPMAPGRSPASEMSPSPSPLPFPATPALPPLHPPPLPPAPYRLSPSSSILLPRGQPLRRARVRPHAIACAATASPKPVREDRVGATLRPCACAPRWRSQALGRPYAILTHGRWVAGGGASFCMRPATGPPQRLSAGEQGRGGRGSGCRAPATALPAHCTPHRAPRAMVVS